MKRSTGAAGLDAVLGGGYPAGRTTLVTGGAGSGKTILGMQFLVSGALDANEPGLFLSLEESAERLTANLSSLAFPLDELLGDRIHLIDGRPAESTIAVGDFDLEGLIAAIGAQIRHHGIRRIVIDAVDALFTLRDKRQLVQQETTRLLRWLDESGVTTLLTVKVPDASVGLPGAWGFAEFAAEGVLQLRSSMHGRLLQRTARVLKLRGSPFVTGDHAYTISSQGIRVLYSPVRTVFADTGDAVRCSSGVPALDEMLQGGYLPGTTTLISGLPGASKTTFGAAFLAAGCAAGERGLFVGFDEPAEQMMHDVRSVGIDLLPYRERGLLRLESFSAAAAIADDFYLRIEELIDQHGATRLVLDPISALMKSGGTAIAEVTVERIVVLLKARGMNAVFTAVSDTGMVALESTPTQISTIADTWIHLSFASNEGERNRTLTIVKARGTRHSSQMREVLLSERGVVFAPVSDDGGPLLLGRQRVQREQELHSERERNRHAVERDLRTLDEELAVLGAREHEVQRQLYQLTKQRTEFANRATELEYS